MIINNIEQLKAALGGLQNEMSWKVYEPFVRQAEKVYIMPAIGVELYDELTSLASQPNTKQTTLLEWLRIATAEYADILGGMRMYMNTSNAGKQVPSMQNMQAVAKWMAVAAQKQSQAKADLALENALQFLEQNKADFQTWAESSVYTLNYSLLLSGATELTKHFPAAKNSRRLYLALRDYIATSQEFYLGGLIGAAQLAAWVNKLKDDDTILEAQEKQAIGLARYALAYQAFAESIPFLNINEDWRLLSETDGVTNEDILPPSRRQEMLQVCQNKAEEYKNRLLNYMNSVASISVFPEYYADVYKPPKTVRATSIENDPSKPYFAF